MTIRLPTALLALVATLAMATTASSQPAGGVTVSPRPVTALPYWSGNSIQTYILVASATWSPPTIRSEGAIYKYVANCSPGGRCTPQGSPSVTGFGEGGVTPHTSESYAGLFAASPGDTYYLTARWRPYTPLGAGQFFDGDKTSSPTILKVPDGLPPRFKQSTKLYLADSGVIMYAECASLSSVGFAGGGSASVPGLSGPIQALGNLQCGSGLGFNQMANDPVDPRFRSIARPKIPPAPKAAAGGGLSAEAATAFTKLFAVQAREIGLARAVLTSINRAQGAQAKKQTAWEKKQMRAAGSYASQLATALLDDVRLRGDLVRALDDPDLEAPRTSADDVSAFRDSLIKKGLPGDMASGLSRLGFNNAEQRLLHGWLLAADAPSLSGDIPSRIAAPKLIARLRGAATEMKAFAKKAAKDPLNTGT